MAYATAVALVGTANVNPLNLSTGITFDGVTPTVGQRILLVGQTTNPYQNGVWIYEGTGLGNSSRSLTRCFGSDVRRFDAFALEPARARFPWSVDVAVVRARLPVRSLDEVAAPCALDTLNAAPVPVHSVVKLAVRELIRKLPSAAPRAALGLLLVLGPAQALALGTLGPRLVHRSSVSLCRGRGGAPRWFRFFTSSGVSSALATVRPPRASRARLRAQRAGGHRIRCRGKRWPWPCAR